MNNQNPLEYCKKCELEITGNYCVSCGNAKELRRIDGRYIAKEVTSVLNFDKGILYTVKELLIRPGAGVRRYIAEDRSRLVKPVIFIIVSSLIYSVLRGFFHFEDGYFKYDEFNFTTTTVIFKWLQNNYGYGNLIMGVFIAFWIKLLFKKYGYNFYEILILLCFVMGIGMIILAAFGTIQGLTSLKVLDYGGVLFIVYSCWAIGQFFDKKRVANYFKALFSYILGLITFTIAVLLLGYLIDLIV
ncbi:membrane-associated HD superfamily phosphohydrolase [Algoriphagus sp. 4150]|uniref:DUF3667 domain-containing protein n=1 Tax=Algoriphagus sp. 4150 TaxID=2817756 RepID=UPI00285862B6|nr:DUF3667 domain-containing protein [Algoriphagus sp. 4150]MDR7130114.1 membrane-associated HD superfamily phosphohydrolase [Algoriphagus sp. 4150]